MTRAAVKGRDVAQAIVFSFGIFMAAGTAPSTAAEIRVFAGGAPQETLRALTPEFEKATGHHITYTFAHVSIIKKKLEAGEQADVILLPTPLIAAAEKAIGLRPEGRSVLARIGIGVIAPKGSKHPDISTDEAVRSMLLSASAIAMPQGDGLTGSHLMRMMTKLGIADAVASKLRHKAAINGGAGLVASGEASVGLYLASEVKDAKGVDLVGMLPGDLQNYIVYAVAIPAKNSEPGPGLEFTKFISDHANRERWSASGFELMEGQK